MMEWEQWLKDQNYTESSIFLYESKIRRFYKFITKPDQFKKGKRFQQNIEFPDNVTPMDGGVLGINLLGIISSADHLIVIVHKFIN